MVSGLRHDTFRQWFLRQSLFNLTSHHIELRGATSKFVWNFSATFNIQALFNVESSSSTQDTARVSDYSPGLLLSLSSKHIIFSGLGHRFGLSFARRCALPAATRFLRFVFFTLESIIGDRNSPVHSTSRHASHPLTDTELVVGTRFQVLFHPPGVLFTFPHGTGSLSVTREYLGWEMVLSRIPTRFLVSRRTQDTARV